MMALLRRIASSMRMVPQSLVYTRTLSDITCKRCIELKMTQVAGHSPGIGMSRILSPFTRPISWSSNSFQSTSAAAENASSISLSRRILRGIGWLGGFYTKKAITMRAARNIYECCADNMAYEDFQKLCKLPDTFQSWFLILQLHVWMCLVRLKKDGKRGRIAYRTLVQIMWDDVEARMKALGVDDPSSRKESLKSLLQEFYGLIVAYDEGIISDDRVLASALWRNLMPDRKTLNLPRLAALTRHVRRQVQTLDEITSEELLSDGQISWLPLERDKIL